MIFRTMYGRYRAPSREGFLGGLLYFRIYMISTNTINSSDIKEEETED
jgi:hypothetical protein